MSTRLQMEILARQRAENRAAAFERDLEQMRARVDRMEQMMEQRTNGESLSQHGSNSRQHVEQQNGHGADHGDVEQQNVHGADHGDEEYDSAYNEDDNLFSPSAPMRKASTLRDNDAPREDSDSLQVGDEAILYAVLRSEHPVAKGIIISTNANTLVGGQRLGREFCEVVVKVVLKRDAMLPRPYADMEKMADAHLMSIAWPRKRVKVTSRVTNSSHRSAGSGGRC
ncbi:hypothetical protein ACP70R_032922 [Stipagrostis hirtigluma subsp. patula]